MSTREQSLIKQDVERFGGDRSVAALPAPGRMLALSRLHAPVVGVVVLFAAVFAFHLLTLVRYPPPFVDEAWNANRAWAMLHTGRAFGTLDSGVFEMYPGYWRYFPWLGTALHVPFVWLFGPTLEAMRLASLVYGMALLGGTYALAHHLFGYRVGLASAAVMGVAPAFAFASHMGRHDIIVSAVAVWAAVIYLKSRRDAKVPLGGFMCGLLIALGVDVHLNALVFIPVLCALFFYDMGWRMFGNRQFWGFAGGVLAGGAFFFGAHIAGTGSTYFELGRLSLGDTRTPPVMVLDPGVWVQSALDTLSMVFFTHGLAIAILAAVSLVILLARRRHEDWRLLMLLGGTLAMFSALARVKPTHYAIAFTPFVCVLAGVGLAWAAGALRSPQARVRFASALVGALILVATVQVVNSYVRDEYPDYAAVAAQLSRAVPPGASIMGSENYWFALPDSRYLGWEQLLYYERYKPGSTLQDAFAALHPTYLVLDGWVDLFAEDDSAPGYHRNPNLLSRTELNAFLASHTQLVFRTNTENYGTVRLYKLVR